MSFQLVILSFTVFAFGYALNGLTITIGYHRALAHNAVQLHPLLRWLLLHSGNWITGLDPKGWVVMHRLHHAHSDTPDDPHSPVNVGMAGILREQLSSYRRVMVGLMKGNPKYTDHAKDLDFELSWLNRRGLWMLPYLTHAAVGLVIGALSGSVLLALAWFAGMMSHPVQGGLVNAFGHAVGGRNFNTPDHSRNNSVVAFLVLGEGFQNNHHRAPRSARFSWQHSEIDLGFAACLALEFLGLLTIEHELLLRRPNRNADDVGDVDDVDDVGDVDASSLA